MRRLLAVVVPVAFVAAGAAIIHRRRHGLAMPAQGGILVRDASSYDRLTGWLLGSFYTGIADDIAAALAPGARVLDVGCGPGHLLDRLASRGLDIAGIDLDPSMIELARTRLGPGVDLAAADVAALPFPDASFDLVVSTLSMHHWSDPAAGLAEIARVLRPEGRAVVFDLGGRHVPLHGRLDGPVVHVGRSALEVVSDSPWPWPGPVRLVRRVEARPRT